MKQRSLVKESLISISGIVTLMLAIVAFIAISQKAEETQEQIERELISITGKASLGIHEFFATRAAVVDTAFQNPTHQKWFQNIPQRGIDHQADPIYQDIMSYFNQLTDADPVIKALFLGTNSTYEYYENKGRIGGDDYFTNKRPWWADSINRNQISVQKPDIDLHDGSIVTVINKPVKNADGEFIGVGGIDILITSLGENLLNKIKFQDQGEAFLVTNLGEIIFFPKLSSKATQDALLKDVDKKLKEADGFAAISNEISKKGTGIARANWKGDEHIIAYHSIKDDALMLDWRVGLIVPSSLIDDPVNKTITNYTIGITLIILILTYVSYGIIKRITKPLLQVVDAMDDMARGEGDLTKRIHVERNDEIGHLSQSFNQFVANIHQLIIKSKQTAEHINQLATGVAASSEKTCISAENQKAELEVIAAASTEMAQTVAVISDNSTMASQSADSAHQQAQDGSIRVNEATQNINKLSKAVEEAAIVVKKLHGDSERINEVLSVIQAIAEQTNLLALNAAIEAARAGDQGRGFAVVADEVRKLAQRTQESTGNIKIIIEDLKGSADNAMEAMQSGQTLAAAVVSGSQEVQNILHAITDAVNVIQSQSVEIAQANREQVLAAEEITEKTVNIHQLADETASQTNVVVEDSKAQQNAVKQLSDIIDKFKV
jgi:methyl-accepting chemotaxis protein